MLSKDSGLQLTLSTTFGKLQLQMPLQLAEQLQSKINLAANSKQTLELALNNNNQILVKLANAKAGNSGNPSQSAAQAESAAAKPLVFGQAKLIGPGQLKLEGLINLTKSNLARSGIDPLLVTPRNRNQAKTTQSNYTNSHLKQLSTASALGGVNLKGAHTLASQHTSQLSQGELSLVSIGRAKAESLASITINSPATGSSSVDSNQLIKNFLRHSFPSKEGLANNIQSMQKQVIQLRQAISENITQPTNLGPQQNIKLANLIITQTNSISELMNQLTKAISMPVENNAKNIIQRLANSGNLLENKLSELNRNSEITTNQSQSIANKKQNLSQTSAINHSNQASPQVKVDQTSLATTDIKLLLVQIKANVEKLINQLNTLTPAKGGSQTSQPTAQLTNNPTNIMTEQIKQALDASNSQLTRTSAAKINESNLSNLGAGKLSNTLFNISQSNQLNRILSEIVTETRSAINQIETNQLLSLRTEQPNIHQFLVDLPFVNNKQIDSFELLFEHSTEEPSKSVSQWKVVVRFDLAPLGPMFAQVELKNNRISTDIFAESQSTAKLINEHLHVLQKSLADAGLDIDKIASNRGKIPEVLVKNSEHTVDLRV